jgi:hypothetical protein
VDALVLENSNDNDQYPPELLLDLVKALGIWNAATKACLTQATSILFSSVINVVDYHAEEALQANRDQLAVEPCLPINLGSRKKSGKNRKPEEKVVRKYGRWRNDELSNGKGSRSSGTNVGVHGSYARLNRTSESNF